jgi:hypothetical protein
VALMAGVRDGSLVRLAALEAERATRIAGLALAAGESDHIFVHWLGVFESGHWPIGTIDGALRIF